MVVAADAANFKECGPLLLFTCPPLFRGWVASAASRKGAAVWARSAARVPIVQRVVAAADAADFKECDPLHYFTFPPSFRGAQVIEEPSPPALDNFQLSCYHLLKIRSLGLHTVELRFLSIRNISRSALFSVGRLFLQGSLLLCIFWRFV